jgi:ABC-2 type transport system ATP-binding protein
VENILEVSNISKDFVGFSLKDISFELKKGYIMGFVGPNGAGKTTTIKLIMNLIKRKEGDIRVFGMDNLAHEQKIKQRIGFVYDENFYYEELTPMELRHVIGPAYFEWDNKAYQSYLDKFKLPRNKAIKKFSRGMKMKLSIALAMSHQAELLIMDEPTSGLDPVFRSEVLEMLQEFMTDENRGILFSSHITSDLDKIADYVCFINEGEIVLKSSREELLEKYAMVKGERKLLNEELSRDLVGLKVSDFGFSGLTTEANKTRTRWKDSVIIERPTLEDIMIYLVRGEDHV